MKSLRTSRAWVIPILLWASSAAALRAQGQQRWIDPASQYRLYLKILTFDRNLRARIGDDLVIGILYAGLVGESRQARDDFARAVAAGPADFQGIPVRTVAIEYGKAADIEAAMAAGAVDALYVTPIDPYDLAPVRAACRDRGVGSFTGVPAYVERGLSVSFRIKGRGAEVLINLGNARAEGSDFSSRLLGMITVVGDAPGGAAR